MRTTLDLDDDLLTEAREIAKKKNTSIGRVVSDLARKGLGEKAPVTLRNGVPVFPPRKTKWKPTLEFINELRDEP